LRKKLLLVLSFMAAAALMMGGAVCEPEVVEEEVEVDEEALIAINNYVEEMTAALPAVKIELQGWVREIRAEDDLPLRYDEERRQWLQEHKEDLEAIRRKHLDTDFPDAEEIEAWDVIIVRGDREWELDGKAWLKALDQLEDLVDEVIETIEVIMAQEGELDMEQSERVLELIEEIEPVIEKVRAVIFRT